MEVHTSRFHEERPADVVPSPPLSGFSHQRGEYWKNGEAKPVREWYREVNGPYNAPLLLDSGGFKLLYKAGLDLSEFGIEAKKRKRTIYSHSKRTWEGT